MQVMILMFLKYISERRLEVFLSHIFFLFFIAQILSPSIGGTSFYLEVPLALINPYFLSWVLKNVKGFRLMWFLIFVSLLACFLEVLVILKILTLAVTVLFLIYAYKRKVFFLRYYLILSICVAIFQLVLVFVDFELSRLVGSDNISRTIWGNYALRTNTNFYTIFFIPRVSGLSREAGFFASLLNMCIIFYYFEERKNGLYKSWVNAEMAIATRFYFKFF